MYAKLTRIQGERRIPLFVNLLNCANIEAAENSFGSRLQFNRSHDPVIAVTESPDEIFDAVFSMELRTSKRRQARAEETHQNLGRLGGETGTSEAAATTAAAAAADQTTSETGTKPHTGEGVYPPPPTPDPAPTDITPPSSDASATALDGEATATTPASSRRGGPRSGS